VSPTERLRSLDLNLLPVLRQLLRARNVTRAAETLNMSQSAVSEALKRLRTEFGDPLLVKVGRRMEPTAFAISLAEAVEQLVSDMEALFAPPEVVPGEIRRQFVIATADSTLLTIGARLIRALSIEAPGVGVQCVDVQWVTQRMLESGELDLIVLPNVAAGRVGTTETLQTDRLKSMLLYEEDFVCICRAGHPVVAKGLDARTWQESTTVSFRANPGSRLFGKLPGLTSADQIFVPQFSLLPFLVAETDAIAMIQRQLAEQFARFLDIAILPLPVRSRTIEVRGFWSAIHQNDPAHTWFRGVLERASNPSDPSAG
jgi:LysR family nod box-dependent transcriptional activator